MYQAWVERSTGMADMARCQTPKKGSDFPLCGPAARLAMQTWDTRYARGLHSGGGLGSASWTHPPIGGALNPGRPAIEDMRVDHGGGHVAVPEELLDCADVVAVLQQVRRKRVTESMAGGTFRDGSSLEGRLPPHPALSPNGGEGCRRADLSACGESVRAEPRA
jgi:hypothetical protein